MIQHALALKSLNLILNLVEAQTRHAPDVNTDHLLQEIAKNFRLPPLLVERIKRAEGFRAHVYQCANGVDTLGYGRNVSQGAGISKEEAEYLLDNDLKRISQTLPNKVPCFAKLSQARQEILIEMAFQLGLGGLLRFKKFLGFLESGNFEQASQAMLKSRWATQTPQRAKRLAKAMLLGRA